MTEDNIHSAGRFLDSHNSLNTKLNKDYLDNLNTIINNDENIRHRSMLDHSLRDIIDNFTNNIIKIIDDIVLDLSDMNGNYEDEDTLDWITRLMNTIYNIFGHIMNKDNCLNVGILFVIISIFIHYFNMTN